MPESPADNSAAIIFDTINAYQRSAVLKASVELQLFTAIDQGHTTVTELARACRASERGVRILCDYLTVLGILTKQGHSYGLTTGAASLLVKRSPEYIGETLDFFLSAAIKGGYEDIAGAVRTGTTTLPNGGSVAPDHPVWVEFARKMMPLQEVPSRQLPPLFDFPADQKLKILDIAAGHGLFGIKFAKRYPNAEITAQDWVHVLEVARQNAQNAGVGDRFHLLPGSAFDVDLGEGYDLVLVPNLLHHFDPASITALLKKVYSALVKGGRAVVVGFVPNEDRVSPPLPAAFSMFMLATTANGDAYPLSELQSMFADAGFSSCTLHDLKETAQRVVIAQK